MTTATTTLVARLDSEDVIFEGTIPEAARLCTRAAANDNYPLASAASDSI